MTRLGYTAALLALLVLVLAAPASAGLRGEVRDSRAGLSAQAHRMPQPANLRVHYFINPQCGGSPCADPTSGDVWVGRTPSRFVIAHETGHVWWYRAPDTLKAWALKHLGFAPDADWDEIQEDASLEELDVAGAPPDEVAADAYAACDLGLSPAGTVAGKGRSRRTVVRWHDAYGYLPSAREHRELCARVLAAD